MSQGWLNPLYHDVSLVLWFCSIPWELEFNGFSRNPEHILTLSKVCRILLCCGKECQEWTQCCQASYPNIGFNFVSVLTQRRCHTLMSASPDNLSQAGRRRRWVSGQQSIKNMTHWQQLFWWGPLGSAGSKRTFSQEATPHSIMKSSLIIRLYCRTYLEKKKKPEFPPIVQ